MKLEQRGIAKKKQCEVAEVFRRYGAEYSLKYHLSHKQRRVMKSLTACRTAALGGHVSACDSCGVLQISYNSCGDRHCPKCKVLARLEWVEKRKRELLPIPYYHVIFTLDHCFIPLLRCNQVIIYNMFFATVANVLKEAGQRYLGGEIGFMSVLHTWGQQLSEHPHIHCLVTGGALRSDAQWQTAKGDFLFPVVELAAKFREAFCRGLEKLWQKKQLTFAGQCAPLAETDKFATLIAESRQKKWQVYIQPPFAEPEITLKYIGRYINRVAMSNHRLISIDNGKVSFHYRDYQDEGHQKELTLTAAEFIRRFLLHILPHRFMRIRYYGLWHANCRAKVAAIRQQLGVVQAETAIITKELVLALFTALTGIDLQLCPACDEGHFVYLYEVQPQRPDPWCEVTMRRQKRREVAYV